MLFIHYVITQLTPFYLGLLSQNLFFSFPDFIYNTLCEEKNLDERYPFGTWPKLVGFTDNHVETKDQTPLHLAIARQDQDLVKQLCETIHRHYDLSYLLDQCATGKEIPDVCYYGGTPIGTALLTGNIEIISILLQYGASLDQTTTKGETFWHSYVRYASAHDRDEEEVADMREVLKGIGRENREDALAIIKKENREGFTPLVLAYRLSSRKMVEMITDIGYKRVFHQQGSFDVESYDIRNLDTITNHISRISPVYPDGTKQRHPSKWHFFRDSWRPRAVSGLEMLFSNAITYEQQIDMMQYKVVRYVIEQKWKMYRAFICMVGVIFLFMMAMITNFSGVRNHNGKIIRNMEVFIDYIYCETVTGEGGNVAWNGSVPYAEPDQNTTFISREAVRMKFLSKHHVPIEDVTEFVVKYILILSFGGINFSLCLLMLFCRFACKPGFISYSLHNIDYLVLYFIFSHSLLLDCICTAIYMGKDDDTYEGGFLYASIITGWLFLTMFSRVFLRFGQIVDLIRRVVKEDLLDFLSLMFILIVCFSAYFHHVFKHKIDDDGNHTDNDDFKFLNTTIISLFSLSLGISEINFWKDADTPWLAAALLILFLIVTYLLLLNSLIAVMTNKCSLIFTNKEDNLRLHRLSCILFIEDLFLFPHYVRPMSSIRVKQVDDDGRLEPVFEICLKRKRHSL